MILPYRRKKSKFNEDGSQKEQAPSRIALAI
jgi:hypothetical protein